MDEQRAESSAFQRWLNKFAVEVVEQHDRSQRGRIRFGTILSELKSHSVSNLLEALREGYDAWV
jgi:predicted O-linked N-acetylglucosamine transferase (SPINDLY family)